MWLTECSAQSEMEVCQRSRALGQPEAAACMARMISPRSMTLLGRASTLTRRTSARVCHSCEHKTCGYKTGVHKTIGISYRGISRSGGLWRLTRGREVWGENGGEGIGRCLSDQCIVRGRESEAWRENDERVGCFFNDARKQRGVPWEVLGGFWGIVGGVS